MNEYFKRFLKNLSDEFLSDIELVNELIPDKPDKRPVKNIPIYLDKSGYRIYPQIYVIVKDGDWLKIGYTEKEDVDFDVDYITDAIRYNDISFTKDHVLEILDSKHVESRGDYYKVNLLKIKTIIQDIKNDVRSQDGFKPAYNIDDGFTNNSNNRSSSKFTFDIIGGLLFYMFKWMSGFALIQVLYFTYVELNGDDYN